MSGTARPACDVVEVSRVLAALAYPEPRDRFVQLRVGPEAFDGVARDIAACLLEDRDMTPAEEWAWSAPAAELGGDNWARQIRSWADSARSNGVRWVERFAAETAARWLPETLRWAATRIESGQDVRKSVMEVAMLIQLLEFLPAPRLPAMTGSMKGGPTSRADRSAALRSP